MATVTRHRMGRAHRVRDGQRQSRGVCDCGALTGWMAGPQGRRAVTAAIKAHERELAAVLEEAERCQLPATHHTPAWEPCPICSAQDPLF